MKVMKCQRHKFLLQRSRRYKRDRERTDRFVRISDLAAKNQKSWQYNCARELLEYYQSHLLLLMDRPFDIITAIKIRREADVCLKLTDHFRERSSNLHRAALKELRRNLYYSVWKRYLL